MNMLKTKMTAVISSLLVSAVSVTAFASDVVLTAAQTQAMNSLEADILAAPGGVRTLNKVTRMYSYYRAPKDQKDALKLWPTYLKANSQQNQYRTDLSYFAGAFWNPANNNTKLVNGGPGWYLAAEPVISETYGDTYYIVDFPATMKMIDVTDPTWKYVSKMKLRPQTIEQLVSSGVIDKTQISYLGMQNGYFTRLSMQYVADINLAVYRKVVSEIFKKNNIQLVAYNWEKTGTGIICKRRTSVALVYVGQPPASAATADRATIPQELLSQLTVNYPNGNLSDFEYSPERIQKVQDSKKFYEAIKAASPAGLTSEEIARLKAVTYECD